MRASGINTNRRCAPRPPGERQPRNNPVAPILPIVVREAVLDEVGRQTRGTCMETRAASGEFQIVPGCPKKKSTLVTDDAHDGSLVVTEQTAQHKVEDQLFLVSLVRASGASPGCWKRLRESTPASVVREEAGDREVASHQHVPIRLLGLVERLRVVGKAPGSPGHLWTAVNPSLLRCTSVRGAWSGSLLLQTYARSKGRPPGHPPVL